MGTCGAVDEIFPLGVAFMNRNRTPDCIGSEGQGEEHDGLLDGRFGGRGLGDKWRMGKYEGGCVGGFCR